MSEKISFQDAEGKRISGLFDVSHGVITVTASDGRTKMAEIEEDTLSPKTLARMLRAMLPPIPAADRPGLTSHHRLER